MNYVEFPKEEANIDFDGGFGWEWLPNNGLKVTFYNNQGEVIRVPKKIYAQACDFIRKSTPTVAMIDSLIADSRW